MTPSGPTGEAGITLVRVRLCLRGIWSVLFSSVNEPEASPAVILLTCAEVNNTVSKV